MAHIVPLKGADQEWVAEQIVRALLKFGHHGSLTLKTDQEPAIVDAGASRTTLEQSPVGLGMVWPSVLQSIETMLRTHKLALKSRMKAKISVKHPIFAWLAEHVADVFNRFAIGTDGETAVQRLKGKPAEGYTHEFATHVMFRVVGKVEGALMAERWFTGLWLGKRMATERSTSSCEKTDQWFGPEQYAR